MADITQSTYTGKYSGLLNNFWVTLTLAGICLVGYELEVHIPRRRGRDGTFQRIPVRVYRHARRKWQRYRKGRWKPEGGQERPSQEVLVREKGAAAQGETDEARQRLGDRESWEFGYIHQPKAWRLNPAPPIPRWPLAWIWTSLKVRERDMPETCGLDLTLHMRFLRGSFFYTLLQACVVLPILMPLHIFYSPDDISPTSMTNASVSSLVLSSGSRWLWVHAVLIWWVTITWIGTVLWITWGGLAYRRREIRRLAERVKESRARRRQLARGEEGVNEDEDRWTVADDREGIKKFRTLMVTNIPPDMRDEKVLQDYFDHYIYRHRVRTGQSTPKKTMPILPDDKADGLLQRVALSPKRLLKKSTKPKTDPPVLSTPTDDTPQTQANGVSFEDNDPAECNSFDSEVDQVVLVRKLGPVDSLRNRRMAVLRRLEIAHVELARRVLKAVEKHKAKHPSTSQSRVVLHPAHDVEQGIESLNAGRNEKLPDGVTKEERMDMLVQALGGYVSDGPEQLGRKDDTVWDVLHSLPRELLDPYQSLTHLTSLFRDQNAPLIDYLTTKLSYLTLLLDEARSKPLSSFAASSAAFVTFKDARTARLALKILDSHPKRSLACHTAPAPDWTELLWPRLSKSVYRSEFVRGWVVYLGVWAFTLIWIFPVSFLCALSSLSKLAGFFKPVEDFIAKYPDTASVITSLVPVLLVAGLTIAICPILLVVANKAETITTRLGIHNSVLERFWKFLMVNGVVFFAIGQASIQAYLTAFRTSDFDPLPTIATAFPTAAPYFASYVLLQTAIQPFFELFRLGLPAIIYVFGTRVSVIPRQRFGRTEHPTFSHFSQLPYQLLIGAIMHLFMLLNPLLIPFCLVYYGSCYVVWKKQFTYVYGRLYENNGKRTSVRVLRYSSDALALAQFVLFAFFILNKARGHAISTGILCFLTLLAKLVITRALKRRFEILDGQEADILCPPVTDDADEPDPERESIGSWRQTGSQGHHKAGSGVSDRLATLKHRLSTWAGRWGYAASHRSVPAGYRKPIPFDNAFFSSLDTRISFDKEAQTRDRSSTLVSAQEDAELQHEPDQAIHHAVATKLVTPHHPLRPWEDIPPYQRMRGYEDQPAYTDDYDDFLWLPRDPLSTLDLDDTVEMRLSLTTSAGGSGRIGDWPPMSETDSQAGALDEAWQEVYAKGLDRVISPDARSDQALIDLPLSPNIGSEVDENFGSVGLVRRGTRKVGEGLHTLFRKPRVGNSRASRSGSEGLSMRTLSLSSAAPSTVSPMGLTETPRAGNDLTTTSQTKTSMRSTDSADRPSILLVNGMPDQQRVPTPSIPPLRKAISASQLRSDSSQSGDAMLVSPTRTSTPRMMAERQESDEIEELDIASPPRTSHLTILGRSPSGRQPGRARAGSRASDLRSPTRSITSVAPARSRSILLSRDRSSSIWSNQQAQQRWLQEVVEEEKLASKHSRQKELEEQAIDSEELEKEGKRRAAAQNAELARGASLLGGNGVGRSGSRMRISRLGSQRSTDGQSIRPVSERENSGGSVSSVSIGHVYPPKTAPL